MHIAHLLALHATLLKTDINTTIWLCRDSCLDQTLGIRLTVAATLLGLLRVHSAHTSNYLRCQPSATLLLAAFL